MSFFKQTKRNFTNSKIIKKDIYISENNISSTNANSSSPALIFQYPSTGDITINDDSELKIDICLRVKIPFYVYDNNGYTNHYDRDPANTTPWPGGVVTVPGTWAHNGGNFYWVRNDLLVLINAIAGKGSFFTKLEYSLDEGNSWNWLYENDNGIGGITLGLASNGDRVYGVANTGSNNTLNISLLMDQSLLLGSDKIRFRLYGYGSRTFGRSTYLTFFGGRNLNPSEIPYENFTTRAWSCPSNLGIAADSGNNYFKTHAIVTEFNQ